MHSRSSLLTRLFALSCVAGLGLILANCGAHTVTGFCAAPRSIAVAVSVRDSTSGLAAADGAIGTLVGTSVDDTLDHVDSLRMSGGDQTGTYTVTIDKPGFLTWRATNVHVNEQGECGNVIPVDLNALLQPATP